ncbi:MAG TPA: hypothetical protein H9979_00150 [Candidatus Megamonas gallistercoris]|nr:hypothetical protein [Candidatus Megamonas gallistercoris]
MRQLANRSINSSKSCSYWIPEGMSQIPSVSSRFTDWIYKRATKARPVQR